MPLLLVFTPTGRMAVYIGRCRLVCRPATSPAR
jgi:hypothetical protein